MTALWMTADRHGRFKLGRYENIPPRVVKTQIDDTQWTWLPAQISQH